MGMSAPRPRPHAVVTQPAPDFPCNDGSEVELQVLDVGEADLLQLAGPAAAVLTRPAHPYAKGLLASMPPLQAGSRHGRLPSIPGQMSAAAHPEAGCCFSPRCPWSEGRCVAGPQVMGALHNVTAQDGIGAVTGHPDDKVGWAIGAGLKVNLPMLGKGDYVMGQFTYGEGAVDYVGSGLPSSWTVVDGTTKAVANVSDAVWGATGTELELVMLRDVATALVLAENAKEIGINITVKQLDGASFFNEEYTERHFFGGDQWPSGPIFLISSLADGPNAGLDQIRWRDAEYLELWKKASNTLDAAARHEIMVKLQEILFERGAWIVPVYVNELALCRADIAGLPSFDQSGAGIFRALADLGFAS